MYRTTASFGEISRIWWAISWRFSILAFVVYLLSRAPAIPPIFVTVLAPVILGLGLIGCVHLVLGRRLGSIRIFLHSGAVDVSFETTSLSGSYKVAEALLLRGLQFQIPTILILLPLFFPLLCFLLLFAPIPLWYPLCSTQGHLSWVINLQDFNLDFPLAWFALELFWIPVLRTIIGHRFGGAQLVIEDKK